MNFACLKLIDRYTYIDFHIHWETNDTARCLYHCVSKGRFTFPE